MRKMIGTLILLLGMADAVSCQTRSEWARIFKEHDVLGTFVLKNISTQETIFHDRERSMNSYVPASTFKILNSMIALQVASITSAEDTIRWDGMDKGNKLWNRDHTMESAFPVSCVWFYQELARRTGEQKMREWIEKSNYGNKRMGTEVDRFWLDGPLSISAIEQIHFLEKLVKNGLPFEEAVQVKVKEIMLTDSTATYSMCSKTGWAQRIGWNVGFVQTPAEVWVFAMNMDMEDISRAAARTSITYAILREEGIID